MAIQKQSKPASEASKTKIQTLTMK